MRIVMAFFAAVLIGTAAAAPLPRPRSNSGKRPGSTHALAIRTWFGTDTNDLVRVRVP